MAVTVTSLSEFFARELSIIGFQLVIQLLLFGFSKLLLLHSQKKHQLGRKACYQILQLCLEALNAIVYLILLTTTSAISLQQGTQYYGDYVLRFYATYNLLMSIFQLCHGDILAKSFYFHILAWVFSYYLIIQHKSQEGSGNVSMLYLFSLFALNKSFSFGSHGLFSIYRI